MKWCATTPMLEIRSWNWDKWLGMLETTDTIPDEVYELFCHMDTVFPFEPSWYSYKSVLGIADACADRRISKFLFARVPVDDPEPWRDKFDDPSLKSNALAYSPVLTLPISRFYSKTHDTTKYERKRRANKVCALFSAKDGVVERFLRRDGDHAVSVRILRYLV